MPCNRGIWSVCRGLREAKGCGTNKRPEDSAGLGHRGLQSTEQAGGLDCKIPGLLPACRHSNRKVPSSFLFFLFSVSWKFINLIPTSI